MPSKEDFIKQFDALMQPIIDGLAARVKEQAGLDVAEDFPRAVHDGLRKVAGHEWDAASERSKLDRSAFSGDSVTLPRLKATFAKQGAQREIASGILNALPQESDFSEDTLGVVTSLQKDLMAAVTGFCDEQLGTSQGASRF